MRGTFNPRTFNRRNVLFAEHLIHGTWYLSAEQCNLWNIDRRNISSVEHIYNDVRQLVT